MNSSHRFRKWSVDKIIANISLILFFETIEQKIANNIYAESFVAWIISWIHIFSLFSFRGENYLPKLATNLRVYSHKKKFTFEVK